MLNRRSSRPRPGLTVVEVLVAMVLLSVGLLAVAGSSAVAMRAAAAARRERSAVARAANRVALLSVQGCRQPSAGSSYDDGVIERWVVAPLTRGAALVDVRVGWHARGGPRFFAVASAVLC